MEGKIHANAFQNPLILDCGHDTPLRNNRMSDINIKITMPVSLWGKNTDTVIEKKMEASRKGINSINMSNGIPIWGKLKALGISIRIKNDQAAYNKK